MIKLLMTDIDGTVLNEKNEYTDKIKGLFKTLNEKGTKVVLATGRMFMGANPVHDELGLDTPLVCYQGAIIRNKNDILHKSTVSREIAREVIKISRETGFHLNLYNNDDLIVEDDNKRFMADYTLGRHTTYSVVNSFDEVELGDVAKLLAIVYNESKLLELQNEMQKVFKGRLCVVRSHKYYLEFTNTKATKGEALKFMTAYYGVKKEETMAAGDQDNDFDMLCNAGIKIAMGNASPKLKSIATYICPPISEDGLSCAIEKFILGKK